MFLSSRWNHPVGGAPLVGGTCSVDGAHLISGTRPVGETHLVGGTHF